MMAGLYHNPMMCRDPIDVKDMYISCADKPYELAVTPS